MIATSGFGITSALNMEPTYIYVQEPSGLYVSLSVAIKSCNNVEKRHGIYRLQNRKCKLALRSLLNTKDMGENGLL